MTTSSYDGGARTSAQDDAGLMRATARGDAEAFEQLYRRHAPACRGRARGVLHAEDWVADVVQAVFLDVWRRADGFDPALGSARSWLLALTHHKAVDLVRQRQRHHDRWAHEDLLDQHLDTGPGPERLAGARDAGRRLHLAVDAVPDPHRETVRLCFLQGLTQSEAAVQLGIPLGTVKTRSRQGVIELRALVPTSLCG